MHRLTATSQRTLHGDGQRRWLVASLMVASLLLAACGGGQGEPVAQEPTTSATSATPTDADTTPTDADTDSQAAAFPVTIEHTYGETTIESEPERIVSVGFTEQDTLLALGVTPVAVRNWFGDKPHATWAWARDELGDAEPTVLAVGELDMEQIAAQDPDLIVGIFSGVTQQQYDRLSQIAPVVAQPEDYVDFGVPWQEQTRILGRATGRQDRAETLISELESRFESVRQKHPQFQGASGMVGFLGGGNANYHLYGPQDLRARFMGALGFDIPHDVAQFVGEEFSAPVSRERLSLTDVDAMVWVVNDPAGREQLADEDLYQNLDVAQQGRDVFLKPNGRLAGALSFSTVLSLPYALDRLVPRLEAAVDGDPTTEVPSAAPEPTASPGS
jgi:iron complex transport system substrate-binding protein